MYRRTVCPEHTNKDNKTLFLASLTSMFFPLEYSCVTQKVD